MNDENKGLIASLVMICLQIDLEDLKNCLEKQIAEKSKYEAIGILNGHKYIRNMQEADKETEKLKAIINAVEVLRI